MKPGEPTVTDVVATSFAVESGPALPGPVLQAPINVRSTSLAVPALLPVIGFFFVARAVLVPITVRGARKLRLTPIVDWLSRTARLPQALGAAPLTCANASRISDRSVNFLVTGRGRPSDEPSPSTCRGTSWRRRAAGASCATRVTAPLHGLTGLSARDAMPGHRHDLGHPTFAIEFFRWPSRETRPPDKPRCSS